MIRVVCTSVCVVAIELLFRTLLTVGINLALVEAGSLLGFTYDVVSYLSLQEALFGIPVTGIEVRMIFLGDLAISLTDLIRRSRSGHAKNVLGINGHEALLNNSENASRMRQRTHCMVFPRMMLSGLLTAILFTIPVASANNCDASDPVHGVQGKNYCIAVETVTRKPGAPLIVVLHGDMSSGKPPTINKWFAEKVAAKLPDATIVAMLRPGYDNGKGKKSQGSTNGRRDHYTATNIDAVAEAITNLASHHNASQTFAIGHSGGAATAAVIAGRHPDVLDGAVLISCPRYITRWRAERNGSAWPASLSPGDYVDRIAKQTRILAVTGRNDSNTRPGLGKTFVAEFRERGGDAKFADQILPMIVKFVGP